MRRLPTIDELEVKGRTVLVRADLNVPMADGRVSDGTRIERLMPTLKELLARGAKVVVLSHFGRPKAGFEADLSLRQVARPLALALGLPSLNFAEDCIGRAAESAIGDLHPGEVALLENLRFHAGETENDPGFAEALADLGDLYVNDAFSCAHRAHASVEAIAHLLPSAAGRGMEAELGALSRVLSDPEKPVMALIGGAKVSTKLKLLSHLCENVQVIAIGGAMANTFLAAKGFEVGTSLHEPDMLETAGEVLSRCANAGCGVILPTDVVVARTLANGSEYDVVAANAVPRGKMILDIGPDSVAALASRIADCRTLVWNGPVGAFETPPFDRGTTALAKAVAKITAAGTLISVAGGGDTVAALAKAGVERDLTYVSTAGGAFLEWLEGRALPGVEVLYSNRES
ncbi:MAG: phosphoglycerate kinase [Proteobacteria bacterium]|nr:phosphoglycerate kinase [Pseudomonadota bacterium]